MNDAQRIPALLLFVALISCGGGGGGGSSSTGSLPGGTLPTNAPTIAPSQQPAETIVLAPTNVFDFYAVGGSYAQTITVSETGYAGTFTSVSANPAASCSGILAVAALASAGGFSLTPLAPGGCIFEFEDASRNESGPVYIEVTTSQVITE
jgi:hypothetical protein